MRLRASVCAVLGLVFAAQCAGAVTPLAHVEKKGSGKVSMVLIPGLGCDWTVWDEFMERNKDRYTMYAVTLPGMAGSESPPAPPEGDTGTPWVDNAVEAIAELIKQRELDDAVVVGHSLGGHIAARFGIDHPELCARVVSIDGFAVAPIAWEQTGQARKDAIEKGFVAQLRSLGDFWYDQFAQNASTMVQDQQRADEITAMMAKTKADVALEYIVELFRADIRDDLTKTDAPTLFVAAMPEEEGPGLADFWEQTVGGGGNVELVMIERARHFIMDDDPEALDEAVADWVK